MAAGSLPESVKSSKSWFLQIRGGMHATPGVAEKWAFNMNSQRLRTRLVALPGGFYGVCQSIKRCERVIHRRRHGGGKVASNTMKREKIFDALHSAGIGLHNVESGRAMRMDIHQSRRQNAISETADSAFRRHFDSSIRADLYDGTVLNNDERAIDLLERRVQRFGGKCKHSAGGPYSIAM